MSKPQCTRQCFWQYQSELNTYQGVFDINDSFQRTKEEVRPTSGQMPFRRTPRAMVGRQVQGGFGHEAQRIQRGQNQVRVMAVSTRGT